MAPDRDHALDSLRAFAMFLGIALHAGLSFMAVPPDFWPVRDAHPIPLLDVALYAVHDFRMQLFFLLAGYFAALLHRRYGAGGMARRRLARVAVPFALAVAFVAPTVQAAGLYAEVGALRAGEWREGGNWFQTRAAALAAADPDAPPWRVVAGYFASGASLTETGLFHLWFLYYLLFFYAAVLLLAPVLGRLAGTRLAAAGDAAFRRVVAGPGRVPVLALLTLPLLLSMRTWAVDTPTGWTPLWHLLGYYFWFFAVGWVLFRHRDLVPAFGRRWALSLAAANVVVLPAMTALVLTGVRAERAGDDATGLRVGAFATLAVYTWLMICGLWGAFLRWFAGGAAWLRYLADASYWCYLASLTPVILFQFWVRDWDAPGLLKFALVTAATTALVLATYEWGVRYTAVGAILNGRKHRRPPLAEHHG